MGTVDGTCAGQVGIDFAPCFVALFPKPFRTVYSGSAVLEVSLALSKGINIQKTAALMSHVYCFLTDTVSSCVTAIMPLHFPQVKWEMSLIIKVLKPISMRIAEAVKSPSIDKTS